ncbi:hypothetical protein AB833_13080 [Chromatiales bacterium (ex Bugula neritina AB1)]|nr:hypothetical protein AB833_13080 [Chromatiales bacterium (ex Bugula neritina AB1)]
MLNYKNILAPVDFAEISNSVLQHAADYSEQSQSKLVISHVVDRIFPDYAAIEISNLTNLEEKLIHQAELHLEELLDELEIGYCEKIVRAGRIIPTLLEIIDKQEIDLVVMGTHTDNSVSEKYRSVTMAMVENADCDVLVLHK